MFRRMFLICAACAAMLAFAAGCGGSSSSDSGSSGGGDTRTAQLAGDWTASNIGADNGSAWTGAFDATATTAVVDPESDPDGNAEAGTMDITVVGESDADPPVGAELLLNLAMNLDNELDLDNATLAISQTGQLNPDGDTYVVGPSSPWDDPDEEATLMAGIKQGAVTGTYDGETYAVYIISGSDNASNTSVTGHAAWTLSGGSLTVDTAWSGTGADPYATAPSGYTIDDTTGVMSLTLAGHAINGQMRADAELFALADTGDDTTNTFRALIIGVKDGDINDADIVNEFDLRKMCINDDNSIIAQAPMLDMQKDANDTSTNEYDILDPTTPTVELNVEGNVERPDATPFFNKITLADSDTTTAGTNGLTEQASIQGHITISGDFIVFADDDATGTQACFIAGVQSPDVSQVGGS